MVGKRAETKKAQLSTRCEIRTLGESLTEDGGGIPSKPQLLAQTLTPGEIAIPGGIQTVRSCLVLYMWVQIHDWDYAFSLEFGLYCVWWARTWSITVVGFAL